MDQFANRILNMPDVESDYKTKVSNTLYDL